jgi:hypothetical protein
MPTPIRRALITAFAGAVIGALALIAIYSRHPGVTLDMEGDLPRLASGFYPPEHAGSEPFAWTAKRARVVLAGLDRRAAWRCAIRFRGARGPEIPQPIVELAVDNANASKVATNTYDVLSVVAPPRPGASGLTVTINSSSAFVPGPADTRELGVQVNHLVCEPAAAGGIVWPPRDTLINATLAAMVFGAALGLIGLGLTTNLRSDLGAWMVIGGLVVLSVMQAKALSSGPAPYTPYASVAITLAIGTAIAIVVVVKAIELVRRQPLDAVACAAIALSGAAFYLDMLGLLHPAKPLVDAVFHAHRFERVLAGSYYFTQPVRNAEFPYAIGLYVVAAPLAAIMRDHVMLLRLVVCAANATAGALLYWMIIRTWGNDLVGFLAVVLFHCVPLPYTVVGNANLTNAFGQSAAVIAIATATTWRLGTRDIVQLLALIVLCAIALLSHVSTFASFSLTMFVIGCLYWVFGARELRPQARSILIALIVAVALSIALYYGHFLNVFLSVGKVSAAAPAAAATTAVSTPMVWRVLGGLAQSVRDIGLPILLLAIAGAWHVWRSGRDRLAFAIVAWGITYAALFLLGSLAPASSDFERYAVEFLSRVDHAVYPAVVIVAAMGAGSLIRGGVSLPGLVGFVLVGWACALAEMQWLQWFV